MTRELRARSGRPRRNLRSLIPDPPPRKEDAACCQRVWLENGRPPIGYCSPECIRRPANWEALR